MKMSLEQKYYKNLFEYNDWANTQFINILDQCILEIDKSLLLLSHLISAQKIWWLRVNHIDPSSELLWEQYTLEKIKKDSFESTSEWLHTIEHDFDLTKSVTYKNTKGEQFENLLQDIITHVLDHSTYHRAQIAQNLRQLGVSPPATNYIFYIRNNLHIKE